MGVAVLDREDNYLYANPQSIHNDEFLNFQELAGKSVYSHHPAQPIQEKIASLLDKFRLGELSFYSRELQTDGQTWELTYHALRDESDRYQGVVRLLSDITQRKQEEAEREKLISELEAKNGELERFGYTISHDLKSPLITIKGFLSYLRQDVLEDNHEAVEDDILQIASAADTMGTLLDDLLELSRIGRLMNPPQEFSLGELAQEAVDLCSGRIRQRDIQVDISPDLPRVFGDRHRILEVLQNLIENSVKFMDDQSTPHIHIGTKQLGQETVYYVQDNGRGIEPRHQEKIFGLFERLSTDDEGTGIGLALIKRIVEVHNGRIWVESKGLGHGSTFFFTLPHPN